MGATRGGLRPHAGGVDQLSVMPDIPAFEANGWLPPGHHPSTWDEVVALLRDGEGSRRAVLTDKLLWYKERPTALGVEGTLLLDGSYVSSRQNPNDVDVMLIAQPEVAALKDMTPELSELLDTEYCQRTLGFSLLYITEDLDLSSSVLFDPREIWDYARDGTRKGVLEVAL
jgi:hypothetical protein